MTFNYFLPAKMGFSEEWGLCLVQLVASLLRTSSKLMMLNKQEFWRGWPQNIPEVAGEVGNQQQQWAVGVSDDGEEIRPSLGGNQEPGKDNE